MCVRRALQLILYILIHIQQIHLSRILFWLKSRVLVIAWKQQQFLMLRLMWTVLRRSKNPSAETERQRERVGKGSDNNGNLHTHAHITLSFFSMMFLFGFIFCFVRNTSFCRNLCYFIIPYRRCEPIWFSLSLSLALRLWLSRGRLFQNDCLLVIQYSCWSAWNRVQI